MKTIRYPLGIKNGWLPRELQNVRFSDARKVYNKAMVGNRGFEYYLMEAQIPDEDAAYLKIVGSKVRFVEKR